MPSAPKKLVLSVVDSLRSDMLLRTIEAGDAPTFKQLLERGELVPDCVSSFPSVTPVCTSEITTGVRPDQHHIPGMNWYHRAEGRYVEYGSSFEATRAFGLFRSLYDTVYNLNMGHLNHEALTCFERLGDAGLRTACTPFLIYRGRTRHEVGLEGLLKAFASAAKFHHAVWGPDELFYGELYSSRKVDCPPTLARPATRDAYSACVARDLVEHDLYDFLLFSLPDNDYYSHRDGPDEQPFSIALADDALKELVDAHGGMDPFLEQNAVIVVADHAQSHVTQPLDLQAALAERWRILQPNDEVAEGTELAVGPSGRGAAVWVLEEDLAKRHKRAVRVRNHLIKNLDDEIELVTWLAEGGEEACVRRGDCELRFAPGGDVGDLRGETWSLDGDLATLTGSVHDGRFTSADYPDALARLWAALRNPNAGDILLSLAPDWECVDWGGVTHIPGGSHGSLRAADSLGTLLTAGLEGKRPEREQWAISDVAGLIDGHFGIGADAEPKPATATAASRAAPVPASTIADVPTSETPVTEPPSSADSTVGGRARDRWDSAADWSWGIVRRVHLGTRQPGNWVQLFHFGVVGGTGYVINLIVFTLLAHGADVNHLLAAVGAFVVAVTNNFLLNRHWTFRPQGSTESHAGLQATRFFTVSLVGLGVNLLVLQLLVDGAGMSELPSQAIAVAVATPVNFIGNKLWTFDR